MMDVRATFLLCPVLYQRMAKNDPATLSGAAAQNCGAGAVVKKLLNTIKYAKVPILY
jgi:hypothetical protein